MKAGILDDLVDGQPSVGIVVAGGAKKVGYLRASGRATVAFTDRGRSAAVEGPVRLIGPDDPPQDGGATDVVEIVRAVYRAAGGTHDDWDEFDRVMADDRRCAVFVRAARVSGN
ncbi:MAG TPA: hypothetical protein VKG43_11705 [Acidimicrobiales bacterium]|nr:hypothetical protein [Acidimicrobiales bacterium]